MPFLPWIECISEGWTGLHTFWDIPGIQNLAHSLDNFLGMESLGNKTSPCSCWKPQTCRGWLCLLQHVPVQTVHAHECVCMCACACTHMKWMLIFRRWTIQFTYATCFLMEFAILTWKMMNIGPHYEYHNQNYNFIYYMLTNLG